MYLDFLVKVPTVKGKITRRKKSNVVYIEYEYDRVYDPSRKYTFLKRVTIGKLSDTDPELMKPNQNFLKYFPDAELPESKNRTSRSSCLRVGTYFVLRKIIEECSLNDILGKYFGSRDMGLFLDLAVYSIIAENNAAQYYPDYTYNHPLFTEKMKQYSDSTVLDFLNSVTDDQSTGFLNTWNESRNYHEKIYISYDSTNKNCQAGDIKMVEFGHPKVDMGEPVFNYAVAYDTHNQEPLFYEKYTAICALEHPMAGKTVPLEEFMKEPLLSREKSSGAYEVFQSAVNQTGLTVTPVWESTSQTTLMEAVHYGLGVTIVPEQMIKREVREGRLSQITFSDFSFQNTIHIAYHHSKYLSPSIKKFILLVKTLDPPESVPE